MPCRGPFGRLTGGPPGPPFRRRDPMLDVAKQAVEAARAAGADYADGRVVADDSESITVRNQEMEGIDRSTSEGLGIRVLVNGYWGFAATARQRARGDRAHRQARGRDREGGRSPADGTRRPRPGRTRDRHVALPDAGGPVQRPARGEGRDADGGDPADAVDRRAGVRRGRDRPVPAAARSSPRARAPRSSRRPSSPARGSRPRRSATASSSAARSRTRSAATSRPRAGSTSRSSA